MRDIEPVEFATYQRDGVAVLRQAVDERWRLWLAAAIEREIEHPVPYYHGYEADGEGYTVRYTGDDVVYDTRPGTNHHLRNASLKDGEALDSAQYPVVLSA